jgi:hypothetical protein
VLLEFSSERSFKLCVQAPQQWEAWLLEANAFLQKMAAALDMLLAYGAAMLILDVKT